MSHSLLERRNAREMRGLRVVMRNTKYSLQAAKPRSGGSVVGQRGMYFKTDTNFYIYKIHMILEKSNVLINCIIDSRPSDQLVRA